LEGDGAAPHLSKPCTKSFIEHVREAIEEAGQTADKFTVAEGCGALLVDAGP
jgi:hypothetical protein